MAGPVKTGRRHPAGPVSGGICKNGASDPKGVTLGSCDRKKTRNVKLVWCFGSFFLFQSLLKMLYNWIVFLIFQKVSQANPS